MYRGRESNSVGKIFGTVMTEAYQYNVIDNNLGHTPIKKRFRTLSLRQCFRLMGGMSFLFGLIGGLLAGAAVLLLYEQFFNNNLETAVGQDAFLQAVIEEESATISVVQATASSVVSIVITRSASESKDIDGFLSPFGDFFFNAPENNFFPEDGQIGAGTGFIISQDGLIVTNKHVVADVGVEYVVFTDDGKKYPAKIIGKDPLNDIALLKIEGENFPAVKLGDSDALQVGQTVIAIGNSLGRFENTVTKGVVSGSGRRVIASGGTGHTETIESAIQTDAAINPGNSGGPLLNLRGEVVGINTAIDLQGQLIGFAIPINEAKSVIQNVKEHGRVVRPYLGVRYVLIDASMASLNNMAVNSGALIVRGKDPSELAIQPESPAQKAGLEENDIILEVNGAAVNEEHDLARLIGAYTVGEEISLKVYHRGEVKEVRIVLGEFPSETINLELRN